MGAPSLTSLLLAILAGFGLARAVRALDLHWSWSLAAIVPAVLLARAAGRDPFPAVLALLLAARHGRAWQRVDLGAGADVAEIARGRRTPLAALRAACSALVSGPPAGRHAGRLLLGRDEHHRRVSVPFGDARQGVHALVLGATGSGKTVTQAHFAAAAIERGMAVVVIDPKGDDGLRSTLTAAAARAGRELREWSPAGPCTYNPFARGGASEIADKALAGERFTEPHYQRQAQRYLGHAVRALRDSGREVTPRALVEQLDPERLELLARGLPESRAAPVFAYLDALTARQRSDLAGVRDRLAILAESDLGPWLEPAPEATRRLVLLDAVCERAVVCFRLESDRRPLLAQMLAGAVIQDLQTIVADLQGRPVPTLVVIDEFSAVASAQVVRLFARARSAGVSLLLATQELADLRLAGRERVLEQVLGNVSLVIAHRQVVPRSAALVSELSGQRGAWRRTGAGRGRHTRRRVREPRLDPARISCLRPGWGAVIEPASRTGARLTRVAPPPGV